MSNDTVGRDTADTQIPDDFKTIQNGIVFMIDRLDYQHYIFRQILHGNHAAPVEEELATGIRVLDVGCGTGRWSVEMAFDYPESQFVGVDIADILTTVDVPENCSFIRGDVLKRLPFPDNSFDYVFQRLMQLSFTPAEWPYALAELRRVTKHGGVVELIEPCVMMERSPPSYTWFYETVSGAAKLRGMDIDFVMSDMTALLTRAGLEKIEADYVSSPLGWGGKAGEIGMRNIEFLIQAMRRTVLVGMTDAEYADVIARIRMETRENRTWGKLYYWYGRKPKE